MPFAVDYRGAFTVPLRTTSEREWRMGLDAAAGCLTAAAGPEIQKPLSAHLCCLLRLRVGEAPGHPCPPLVPQRTEGYTLRGVTVQTTMMQRNNFLLGFAGETRTRWGSM